MPIAIEPSVELSRMVVEVGRSMVGNARFQARRRDRQASAIAELPALEL